MTAGTAVETLTRGQAAEQYERQSERLGFQRRSLDVEKSIDSGALEAKFITAQDAVIRTANGGRLPGVPVAEARQLNSAKDILDGVDPSARPVLKASIRESKDGVIHGILHEESKSSSENQDTDRPLHDITLPSSTNPLFPELPLYGPPSFLRDLQCYFFRASSGVLSLTFLLVIILGAVFTSIPPFLKVLWSYLRLRDPDAQRPLYEEEKRLRQQRHAADAKWARRSRHEPEFKAGENDGTTEKAEFEPLEGGPDPLVCDVRYYARRVGLEVEEYSVQTEDGFIIELYHIYIPGEYQRAPASALQHRSADVFRDESSGESVLEGTSAGRYKNCERKYPVLLIHGLLQSAGAFCCTDDNSLAFFLAKSGFDVWLGNNRCGFKPKHNLLSYEDPRMWAWNIRQMGVMDLPALISRVLSETGFEKLGLIAHSQGTTQALVALAKEQRPDIGKKISVFCALAPAAYSGPLIRKMYFKFMQIISPAMFRLVFGRHSFIPFMMLMHSILPGSLYGAMGYRVFSFMFNWTDDRWEKDIRSRFFQFSPVYVSAESMRWWLGRECFAKHKCILSTCTEGELEDQEDAEEDDSQKTSPDSSVTELSCANERHHHNDHGRFAWYDEQAPPFAFWVAGSDGLVDGRRLLRRFERGREPHVKVVHQKVIEEYEHLDVIWAMDSIEQVGKEVRDVLWKTVDSKSRELCRTPRGCETVEKSVDSDSSTKVASVNRLTEPL